MRSSVSQRSFAELPYEIDAPGRGLSIAVGHDPVRLFSTVAPTREQQTRAVIGDATAAATRWRWFSNSVD